MGEQAVIKIEKVRDLEEDTGIPAIGVWFSVVKGTAEEVKDWLTDDLQWHVHSRQIANLEFGDDGVGYFIELNSWDTWENISKKNDHVECEFLENDVNKFQAEYERLMEE